MCSLVDKKIESVDNFVLRSRLWGNAVALNVAGVCRACRSISLLNDSENEPRGG